MPTIIIHDIKLIIINDEKVVGFQNLIDDLNASKNPSVSKKEAKANKEKKKEVSVNSHSTTPSSFSTMNEEENWREKVLQVYFNIERIIDEHLSYWGT